MLESLLFLGSLCESATPFKSFSHPSITLFVTSMQREKMGGLGVRMNMREEPRTINHHIGPSVKERLEVTLKHSHNTC